MDDPNWSWPAWKFGMRKDDLFTTLHDQYNTFSSAIQDPDAFHHDVYELSNEASSVDEFHRLMADRKAQRLTELNESLESASFEIIANPSLIGTAQWEYALQLFRTRSLDSLVRYFASYLPSDHPWHHDMDAPEEPKPFFNDRCLVEEPSSFASSHELPPSPRSLTTCSNNSESDRVPFDYQSLTPARTLSFSDSESDHFREYLKRDNFLDDASSQSSEPQTPLSDLDEAVESDDAHACLSTRPDELSPSKTTTPTPPCASIFFDVAKPALLSTRRQNRGRSLSPSRCSHLVTVAASASHHPDCRRAVSSHRPSGRPSRLDCVVVAEYISSKSIRSRPVRRREGRHRVQKPQVTQTRLRERRERDAADEC